MSVGKKLREIRQSEKLTIRALAKKSGVSSSYISDLENEKNTKPSFDIMNKIAAALNVPVSYFSETLDSAASKTIYNKMSDTEILKLWEARGLNSNNFKELSPKEKKEIIENYLSKIEPYKLQIQNNLDNFDNLTKEEFIDTCNSIKEHYVTIIDNLLSEYNTTLNTLDLIQKVLNSYKSINFNKNS